MTWDFHRDEQSKHLSWKSVEVFEPTKRIIKSILNFKTKHGFFWFTVVQLKKHFPPELFSFTDRDVFSSTVTSFLYDFRQIERKFLSYYLTEKQLFYETKVVSFQAYLYVLNPLWSILKLIGILGMWYKLTVINVYVHFCWVKSEINGTKFLGHIFLVLNVTQCM